MNAQEAFESFVWRKGFGRIDDQHLIDYHARWMADLSREFARGAIDSHSMRPPVTALGTMPSVYFDLINSDTANAHAFSEKGFHCIGVHLKLLDELNRKLHRMMAWGKVRPEIGEVKPGRASFIVNDQFYEYGGTALKENEKFLTDSNARRVATTERRREHANWLFQICVWFIVFHELAHIRDGHIEFKKSLTGLSEHSEFDLNNDSLSPTDSQTLEMAADCFATANTIDILLKDPTIKGPHVDHWPPDAGRKEAILRDWSFAIQTLFIFLSTRHKGQLLQNFERSHPSARVRQVVCARSAQLLVHHDEKDIDPDKFFLDCIDQAIDADVAFQQTNGIDTKLRDSLQVWGEEGGAHLKVLADNWKELRPKLLSFAHSADLMPS